jgi:hypothetical protein
MRRICRPAFGAVSAWTYPPCPVNAPGGGHALSRCYAGSNVGSDGSPSTYWGDALFKPSTKLEDGPRIFEKSEELVDEDIRSLLKEALRLRRKLPQKPLRRLMHVYQRELEGLNDKRAFFRLLCQDFGVQGATHTQHGQSLNRKEKPIMSYIEVVVTAAAVRAVCFMQWMPSQLQQAHGSVQQVQV